MVCTSVVYCQFTVLLAGCSVNDWEIRLWFQAGMLVFLITTFKQAVEAHPALHTICTVAHSTWWSGCGMELTVDYDLVSRWRDACCMSLPHRALWWNAGSLLQVVFPTQYVYRPLPIIDVVLPHNKLLTYTSLFMFCYQMSQQHRNNASKFVNRPTPYVRRTSQPDTKTKTTPQPHPRVVEALNRLLASTFTVCLRRFCCLVCFPFLMSIIGFWDHWCFGNSVSIVTDCILDGWCLIPGRAEISSVF